MLTDESSAPAIHSLQPAWLAGLESSLLILYASHLVKRKSPQPGNENVLKDAWAKAVASMRRRTVAAAVS